MDWKNLTKAKKNIEILEDATCKLEHLHSIRLTPTKLDIEFTSGITGKTTVIHPILDLKVHIQLCKILQQHYTDQINRSKANLAGLGVTNYE